jgi:hypothetical protein
LLGLFFDPEYGGGMSLFVDIKWTTRRYIPENRKFFMSTAVITSNPALVILNSYFKVRDIFVPIQKKIVAPFCEFWK